MEGIHGELSFLRPAEIFEIEFSYLTQRKNKKTSKCHIKVLKGGGIREAIKLFYERILDFNMVEEYRRVLNVKILSTKKISDTIVSF